MTILKYFLITLLSFIALAYLILFTSLGNRFIANIIEAKLNEALEINAQIEKFILRPSSLETTILLSKSNTIALNANFSLIDQSFNAAYQVTLDKPAELEQLLQIKLYDVIHTHGRIEGDIELFSIKGESDIADSATHYSLHVKEKALSSVKTDISDLALDKLLKLLGKSPYAQGSLNLQAELDTADMKNPLGDIHLQLTDGIINIAVMQKDFNVSLPESSFSLNSDIGLQSTLKTLKTHLDSNLAKIIIKGVYTNDTTIDASSNIRIKELALFEPLTNVALRGALNVDANIKGDKEEALLHVKSDIAKSYTKARIKLNAFEPSDIQAEIKHLDLVALLNTLHQQPYLSAGQYDGILHVSDIKNLTLSAKNKITNLRTNAPLLQKLTNMPTMPSIHASISNESTIQNNTLTAKTSLQSSLADLTLKQSTYNLDSKVASSDFSLSNLNLAKLKFATNRDLRGVMQIDGNVTKDATILMNAQSHFLGGKIDITLRNKDLHVTADKLQSLKLLHTLTYPEYFSATMTSTMDYNLKHKSGTISSRLTNGRFMSNSIMDAIRDYTHENLYKQRFKGNIESKIEDNVLITDLVLNSNNTSIVSKKGYLNTLTKQSNIRLHVKANNNPIDFHIKGNINKPNITIDASQLIKKEATKQIGNFLNSFFK